MERLYEKKSFFIFCRNISGLEKFDCRRFIGYDSSDRQIYDFVEKYAHIRVPKLSKYTLEPGEELLIDDKKWNEELHDGINFIKQEHMAETSVYVRKDWFYYLDAARQSAEICQQKPGTHCESWYGFFSRVLYANVIQDEAYTQ